VVVHLGVAFAPGVRVRAVAWVELLLGAAGNAGVVGGGAYLVVPFQEVADQEVADQEVPFQEVASQVVAFQAVAFQAVAFQAVENQAVACQVVASQVVAFQVGLEVAVAEYPCILLITTAAYHSHKTQEFQK
jgi:hypothetical protein